VPEGQALNLRLDLANTIETAGGKEGWKLFDDKDFGATYFSLQIKKQRAIMGELARTIMQMEMIRNAVVQLSIPEKSLFVEEQEEPTASVMVSLVEDAIITDDQVKTIQAFVAGSIEGLKAENVTVADTQGNELTKIKEVDTVKQELDHQERVIQIHQRQRKDYERYLERKILTQLSSIFGVGHVTANVSVEFDYTHRRQNQIEYEKKGTPIAEATKMSGNGTMPRMAEGVTGVEAHIPTAGTETGVGGTGNQQYVAETIRNYGVGKTETETEHPDYQIKRVAAAVCVDNFPTAITNENGETVIKRTKNLTDEDLDKIEGIVQGAINYNEERPGGLSDLVAVTNIPFGISAPDRQTVIESAPWWKQFIPYAYVLMIILFVGIFFMRPLFRVIAPKPLPPELEEALKSGGLTADERVLLEREEAMGELPGGRTGEAYGMLGVDEQHGAASDDDANRVKQENLDDEIMDLARAHPKKVPLILKSWIES